MTALMMFLLMATTAHAGKLHDGFMGVPYGPDTVLKQAPHEGCKAKPEPSVAWECTVDIGDAKTVVAYMADEGVFFAVIINTKGYTDSAALFDVLQSAYGKGRKSNQYDSSTLPKWEWSDGGVSGNWKYNEFSNSGQFMVLHSDLYGKIKARAEERAKAAAGAL